MKKLPVAVILILCVFLLCACSLKDITSLISGSSALLPSSGGIDWNNTAKGKGKVSRPADFVKPISFTTASIPYKTHNIEYHYDDILITAYLPDMYFIGDDTIRDKISTFCKSSIDAFIDEVTSLPVPNKPDRVTSAEAYASCYCTVVSNYITVNVNTSYYFTTYRYDDDGRTVYDDPDEPLSAYTDEYSVFDLRTGERLSISDLFYSDSNYADIINAFIAKDLDESFDDLKRPFKGIPKDYNGFSLSSSGYLDIIFPEVNPYTDYSYTVEIPFWALRNDICLEPAEKTLFSDEALTVPDDFGDTLLIYDMYFNNSDYVFDTALSDNGESTVSIRSTDPDAPDLAPVNELLKKCNDDVLASDVWQKAKADEFSEINYDCSVIVNIVNISISAYYSDMDTSGEWDYYDYVRQACFDLNTGKELFLSDVITSEADLINNMNGNSDENFALPEGFSLGTPVSISSYGLSFTYGDRFFYADNSVINNSVWRDTK